MPQTGPMVSPAIAWSKVDVLTAYQRLTGEIQMRVRLRETMNDPEPLFHLRNVSAEPLLPGAVALNGVPEGLFSKALVCGIRTFDTEPPPPDQVEVIRRYAMYQAGSFMVTGAAEFPKARTQDARRGAAEESLLPAGRCDSHHHRSRRKELEPAHHLGEPGQMLALYLG